MNALLFADILFTGLTLLVIFAILRWLKIRKERKPADVTDDTGAAPESGGSADED